MNTHAGKWVIFLTLINAHLYDCTGPFTFTNRFLTAVEGSCIDIRCTAHSSSSINAYSHWFWMKEANWTKETEYFGTVVFSTLETKHPVSPEFKNRVKYISSPGSEINVSERMCSILICDLRRNDSGKYEFRFVLDNAVNKWMSDPVNLTVKENPCPITFSQPPAVKENDTVVLTCSTLMSCDSEPRIEPLHQWTSSGTKSFNYTFTASWEDDGRVFSCQTTANKDKYLIRNITLTVEYPPKNVRATMTPETVKEGESVTLTCSAKGQPNVTFTWFKNKTKTPTSQLQLTLQSANESDSGQYYCEAQNQLGTKQSNTLNISVLYKPEVHILIQDLSNRTSVTEGERITLVCDVRKSNPNPDSFSWTKDGKHVKNQKKYTLSRVKPEDNGHYTCTAHNSVGSGTSSFRLNVLYKPRSSVSISAADNKVKVYSSLTFSCDTKANPDPSFSWFYYKQSDSSNWIPLQMRKQFTLESVQRTDEGCYVCNASNQIGNGNISQPKCIQILFPPTNVLLSLAPKVKEGQSVTITCTTESFPLSRFQLKKYTTSYLSSPNIVNQTANEGNVFTLTFNATHNHTGFYTCIASNTEGENRSMERKLEVEYSPKDVKVEASSKEVKENGTFSLRCTAHSHPPITQYRWIRINNDKKDITVSSNGTYTVNFAKPSDSGLYVCEVQNVIGSGKSQLQIKIKYAPKQVTIDKGEEQQYPGGRRSVILSCSSDCYPSAEYIWYNKTDQQKVSQSQNLTVYSNQAGEYYCTAKNELGYINSDTVRLFDGRVWKTLKIFGWLCIFLLVIILIVLYRRNKAHQQRMSNTGPCCFLPLTQCFHRWWKRSERRNTRNENILAGASRSRDDLLPEQHSPPKTQHLQRCPDVTSTSQHINTVYSTVNFPFDKQAPSAQGKTQRCMEDDSLNYASLHIKKKKAGPETIYSQVCKPTPCKKQAEGNLEDYENINPVSQIRVQYNFDDDSETSDEEEVSYSDVNIIPKPSHQTDTSDSSTSEDETQNSEVKL